MADFRLSSNTSPSKTDSISPFEEDPYIGRRGLQHQTLAASEFSQHLIDEFFNQMSEPLKRMQVEYLTNATKKRYEKKFARRQRETRSLASSIGCISRTGRPDGRGSRTA
jgi:lipopolysaccharide biosynthesis glycosyltransferase